ncbi:MAG: quinol dehydrogenase ferredoxin subunit NapH [Campylobacterales bacterium]|nr:quinol dehydrogenase ferredoxin subunit NapH [Campylobacterales bacterium]
MISLVKRYRYLLARRVVQLGLLGLYLAGNVAGWSVLKGNLSSSLLFGTVPLADPFALVQIFATGALVSMSVVVGAVIIALFYALVGGRAFCAWVCPMNMVTDAANGLRRALMLDKSERKVWLGRGVRYWVLGLSLVLSFALGVAAFEMVSPIGILHRGVIFGMGMGFAAVLSIFLFDLFGVKNGWCGHVCPLGAFYAILGQWSAVRVMHHQPSCTLCMKCKEICPEKQVLETIGKRSGAITMGACINCGRCVEVCEDNALSFGVRRYIHQNE